MKSAISKLFLKRILAIIGFDTKRRRRFFEKINKFSINLALSENRYKELVDKLKAIEPDISEQEESEKKIFNDYWEFKRRVLQAFQCTLMLEALKTFSSGKVTVVDIGDSRGTHMLYLRQLTKNNFEIDSISINSDPRAIAKIKANGLEAMLCRAEELDLGEKEVDLFVSFETLEHLHNPALFLHRLAKKYPHTKLVITVPYLKNSRVGLHNIRDGVNKTIFAEDEHIFELAPEDWELLMLHSGWKVVESRVYYQYPKKWLIFSGILAWYWRNTDFAGFWGAILKPDTTLSDLYQDWESGQ